MPRSNRTSIAFRLIAAVLGVELVAAVLVVLVSWGYERHVHFHAFDVMLRGRADSVLGAVQDAEDLGANVMLDMADLHVPPDDVYEVWDGRGHLLGRSANWPGSAGFEAPNHNGFSKLKLNSRHYRILRLSGTRIVDPGEPGGGHLRFVTILYGAPTEPVWHAIQGSVEFYAAGGLLVIVLSGPLVVWVLHRELYPLRELAAQAEGISVNAWEFAPPESARSTPELAPLTSALENVLGRLERSFTQQRVFVSDAAHELKTAVAVIKSSLQLLSLKPRSPGEYKLGLERCLADSERLEELVTKMLTLARVENGTPAAGVIVNCDLVACTQAAVKQLETLARLRGVTIDLTADAACTVPLTTEDGILLVENLLHNALQHSPAHSHVEVRMQALTGTAPGATGSGLLVVQDRGEGIAPDALPNVFDRFYRGDPSRSRATGGAGLGLAICKALVEKVGGSIEIKSELGQGTTVSVRLPQG